MVQFAANWRSEDDCFVRYHDMLISIFIDELEPIMLGLSLNTVESIVWLWRMFIQIDGDKIQSAQRSKEAT